MDSRTVPKTVRFCYVSPMRTPTYRRVLRDVALDQHGYVTTDDAVRRGVPPVELRKLAARGFLEKICYGVYRFEDIPRSNNDPYVEAVLCAGPGAALAGDAVLAMHGLGLVNPRQIRVAVPRQPRRKTPHAVRLVWDRSMRPEDLTTYDGVRAQKISKAIEECRGHVMTERLLDAGRQAIDRGLERRESIERVLSRLETDRA
jgi:predicted transcriptional regulator of viral defense system